MKARRVKRRVAKRRASRELKAIHREWTRQEGRHDWATWFVGTWSGAMFNAFVPMLNMAMRVGKAFADAFAEVLGFPKVQA